MTAELRQTIKMVQALSLSEQLELLKALSSIIQKTYSQEFETAQEERDAEFSAASFQTSWQQAMTGETLPLSQLWDDFEDD